MNPYYKSDPMLSLLSQLNPIGNGSPTSGAEFSTIPSSYLTDESHLMVSPGSPVKPDTSLASFFAPSSGSGVQQFYTHHHHHPQQHHQGFDSRIPLPVSLPTSALLNLAQLGGKVDGWFGNFFWNRSFLCDKLKTYRLA